MGIADRLVLHRAQPEALRGVVGRLFQAAIVEAERLGLAIFQEQFAVVGAFEALATRWIGRAPRSSPARSMREEVGVLSVMAAR